MASLVFAIVASGALAQLSQASTAAPSAYGPLLAKYVKADGVKYAAWHANKGDIAALKEVTDFYASTHPPKDRDTSLAWHLNAYNAWILQSILAKYPTKGPLSGNPLFFHAKNIVISGSKTSFDHLEQKVIRPQFKEPRIHFALNCASESCPPLMGKPFTPSNLDVDLTTLAERFVNANPQGLKLVGNVAKVSKLFDWYAEDFGGKKGVVDVINRYLKSPLPSGVKVEYLEYSWDLNASQ